jgi:hypothetical protein
MIDENKIEQLLQAFYDGDTTPEEEEMLFNFFNSENINDKWHTERDTFNVLYDSEEVPLPKGITKRLESAIDKHIAETTQKSSRRKIFIAISSAAAIALLCIGLFFIYEKDTKSQMFTDTFTNPEDAALATEQALIFVSDKLNHGLSSLEKVREGVNKSNKILYKAISIEE